MAQRGRKAKSPFADLSPEFKDAVAAMSIAEINQRIAEVAKAEEENQRMKKEDQQLAEAREAFQAAGAGYREATKSSKLMIRYAMLVLADKGGA